MGLEYQDAAQQLTAAAQQAEEEAGPPEEWTEAQLPPLPDVTTDAVRAALAQLQQLLHVEAAKPGAGSSSAAASEATPEGLQRAHAMLETCVLPALAELAKQRRGGAGGGGAAQPALAAQAQGAAASQHAAVAAMLSQYPLGFSTGEAGADLGATILRMLYIKDLRALQVSAGNGLIVVPGPPAGTAWCSRNACCRRCCRCCAAAVAAAAAPGTAAAGSPACCTLPAAAATPPSCPPLLPCPADAG